MAFQVLFYIAAYHNLDINQIDIKTAFLYGFIDQFIYIKMPKSTKTSTTQDLVCKLYKVLYDLK